MEKMSVEAKQKKKYRYLLTKKGVQEKIKLTEKFVKRKKKEYKELQRELDNYQRAQTCKQTK